MNSRFNRKLQVARNKFNKRFNVKEQQIKEEVLISKLEDKLGKPKNEVKSMLSEGLLNILTKVPFSTVEK